MQGKVIVGDQPTQTQVLDAAEELFYGRGIQSVGMDELREAAGVSLKRLYQQYGSKDQLVEAFLQRRDERWRQRLADYVETHSGAEERILAVFNWLGDWFSEPGFRGCAWINAYGELGAVTPAVARLVREHKAAFKHYLAGLVIAADLPADLAAELMLLAEGAMVTAGIFATPEPASQARNAAQTLIRAARRSDTAARQVRAQR
jgi:AcrR family transcriptional regulator